MASFLRYATESYLFDFCLQVSQLDALLQVPAVLLSRQVKFLLLLMEKLQ